MAVFLEAKNLRKEYGPKVALHGLNLSVGAGEIYCLLGANGAGKTTTINLFLDFIRPTSGQALIAGIPVEKEPIRTKEFVAYIPEVVMLYRNLTGLENLRYFCALAGNNSYSNDDLIRFLLDAGLREAAINSRVGGFSKGMRQKVGIAIAVAKRAKVLLLDEPTSGLDPKAANEFSELLLRLRSENVAVLMATHDLFRVKEVGTHAGIMREGRLVDEFETCAIGHSELEKHYLHHMR